jgi:hypothetical protein
MTDEVEGWWATCTMCQRALEERGDDGESLPHRRACCEQWIKVTRCFPGLPLPLKGEPQHVLLELMVDVLTSWQDYKWLHGMRVISITFDPVGTAYPSMEVHVLVRAPSPRRGGQLECLQPQRTVHEQHDASALTTKSQHLLC